MAKFDTGMGKEAVKVLSEKTVYDGFFKMYEIKLQHKTFAGEWMEPIRRELFHRGEAAAAICYDPENDLVGLIEQFRVGAIDSEMGPWCLEVVAGMLEEGETPDELMARELAEEAGITNATLIPISRYYSTPGGCNEKIHLYAAICNLANAGGIYGLDEEHEDIRFETYPAEDVFKSMYAGRTNNSATLLGLQWIQINREKLRQGVTEFE
ncbi:nudix hydroxylase [Teredinibacter turnerae T7901]|uniref:ADP-ribose pyrophosphatase n=1 Tax=Teredinibacter turnerae (strain ATCC 39867 / T7901) TaxID=377629 RepID=C5BTK6_TERTT|nr:NUDIX domain-containing protein [Teredinibacter turnerae]ACR13942.1 nudix hydroxylase [Teredinibacter turnerae T7901]